MRIPTTLELGLLGRFDFSIVSPTEARLVFLRHVRQWSYIKIGSYLGLSWHKAKALVQKAEDAGRLNYDDLWRKRGLDKAPRLRPHSYYLSIWHDLENEFWIGATYGGIVAGYERDANGVVSFREFEADNSFCIASFPCNEIRQLLDEMRSTEKALGAKISVEVQRNSLPGAA